MLKTIVAVLVTGALMATGTPGAASGGPRVYAHRGGAALAPENTLGAFRQAVERFPGVWLEMDAQLTADGVAVIIHDDTLDRTTDCTGAVAERPYAEIATCDAAVLWDDWGAEAVPRLEDVLVEGRDEGWKLMIEIKNIPGEANFEPTGTVTTDELLRLVAETAFPVDDLLVQSFWPPVIDHVKAVRPDIPTALLTTAQLPGAPPGGGFTATENAAYAAARGHDVSAPDRRSPDLSTETVAAVQALGLEVVLWTVNTPEDIDAAIRWGVDGIISDHPDRVYGALGRDYR